MVALSGGSDSLGRGQVQHCQQGDPVHNLLLIYGTKQLDFSSQGRKKSDDSSTVALSQQELTFDPHLL
jgi:hypothetical protein